MSESPTPNQTGKLDAIFIINIVSLMLTFISTVILGLKLRMKCCCGEISMKGKDNTSKDSPSPPTTTGPPAEVEMPATESHMRGRSRTTKRRSLERRSNSPEKEKTQEDDEQEEAEAAVEAPVESPAATKMPLTPETGSTASKKKRPSSVIIKQGGAEVIVEIVQPSPPAGTSGLQQAEKC